MEEALAAIRRAITHEQVDETASPTEPRTSGEQAGAKPTSEAGMMAIGANVRLVRECSPKDMKGCCHVSCESNLKAKASWQDSTGIGRSRVVINADKRRACGNRWDLSR